LADIPDPMLEKTGFKSMAAEAGIGSEFLHALLRCKPGERLPSLIELSDETKIGVGKLREQMEVARTLGLVEASPRRGITRTDYSFLPAVRLSLLVGLTLDRQYFDAFSTLRAHLEVAFWDEAVVLLTAKDVEDLRALVQAAWVKLNQTRVQIPYPEHRELHLTIFRRLNNPFVQGLLEAYWDGYEAVELNTYADYAYLKRVWQYHEEIVEAIGQADYARGKRLLIEHMRLLTSRGVALETPADQAPLPV
jgi:DNA-binding FadR family transcriptional regulator